MSANNSKPKNANPVIVLREEPSDLGRHLLLLLPALLGSVIFHAALVVVFVIYVLLQKDPPEPEMVTAPPQAINAEPAEEKKETFTVVDVDPAAVEYDTDVQFANERIEKVSVPGANNPDEAIGIKGGDPTMTPFNIPNPGGYGTPGQGGAIESNSPFGIATNAPGFSGGGIGGMALEKTFAGRSGSTRQNSLREGGGTKESEACVTQGLKWLIRQQLADGRWTLGNANDARPIAATAFGLLPFLAAGKTHKPAKDNPYDKAIDKGLNFLKRSQDQKTGFFGGNMYDHGLATIAMCEAYGLSQDPALRRSAQLGINLIVSAQDARGGWGYNSTGGGADMSVSGWQIMALKSGQMAGLVVSENAIQKTKNFLRDGCSKADDGYPYNVANANNNPSTYRMTAVGLLCRQYMENWGPSNPSMIKAIKNFIQTHPPTIQDVYYYYYATQVMHHFGGQDWRKWNDVMRETLIKKQDATKGTNEGSWDPAGDPWGTHGGRLMITSLNLLTLEVYYRYLPLYYRDAGYGKDDAVKKAI